MEKAKVEADAGFVELRVAFITENPQYAPDDFCGLDRSLSARLQSPASNIAASSSGGGASRTATCDSPGSELPPRPKRPAPENIEGETAWKRAREVMQRTSKAKAVPVPPVKSPHPKPGDWVEIVYPKGHPFKGEPITGTR